MTPLLAALAAQTESSLCLCLKTKGKVGSDAVALQQHGHRSPGSYVGARGHAGEEGCGAPDHTLTPVPVLKPASPAWISWAVAGRKCGYLWRGWLLATGEWWLGMCQHDFSCGGSSAGTYIKGHKLISSLQPTPSPTAALASPPSLPAATKSPSPMNLAASWLPPWQAVFLPAVPSLPSWPGHLCQVHHSILLRALRQGMDLTGDKHNSVQSLWAQRGVCVQGGSSKGR